MLTNQIYCRWDDAWKFKDNEFHLVTLRQTTQNRLYFSNDKRSDNKSNWRWREESLSLAQNGTFRPNDVFM